jgi:Ran GTPase-activating protein (RanGAP) involved in mRNA processing and transport
MNQYPNGVAQCHISEVIEKDSSHMMRILTDIQENNPVIQTLDIRGFQRRHAPTQILLERLITSLTANHNPFVTRITFSQHNNSCYHYYNDYEDADEDEDEDEKDYDCEIVSLSSLLQHTTNIPLMELNLSGMGIQDFEIKILANAISNSTSLESLILVGNNIRCEGCTNLCQALVMNKSLKILNLSCNSIGVFGATSLGQLLYLSRTTTPLEELYLCYNVIGNDGLKEIAKGLDSIQNSLRILTVDDNGLDDIGVDALSKTLSSSHISLMELSLSSTVYHHDDEGRKALAEALKWNTSLQVLCLSFSNLGNQGIKLLSDALRTNYSLTQLDLKAVQMNCHGAIALANALVHESSRNNSNNNSNRVNNNNKATVLTKLDISHNQIGDDAMKIFARVLITNTSLQNLHLGSNIIGDEGIQALSNGLKYNSSLWTLNLSENERMTGDCFGFLADALYNNGTLKELNLSRTSLSWETIQTLVQSLQFHPSLTTLIVRNCPIHIPANPHILQHMIPTTKINTETMLEDLLILLIGNPAASYLAGLYCHCFPALRDIQLQTG